MENLYSQDSFQPTQKIIVNKLLKCYERISQYILKKTQIQLELIDIIKIQIFIFQRMNYVQKTELLKKLLQYFLKHYTPSILSLIIRTIKNQNSLNKYIQISKSANQERLQFIEQKMIGFQFNIFEPIQIAKRFIYVLERFAQFHVVKQAHIYRLKKTQNLICYIQNVQNSQEIKYLRYLDATGYIDKNFILSYLQKFQNKNNIRYQAINLIFDKCVNKNSEQDNGLAYNALLLIQYILGISDKKFSLEFGIQSQESLTAFVRTLKWYNVKSLQELKQKAVICNHIKYGHMRIEFNDIFNVQDIDDSIIHTLFRNNEQRLQRIYSNTRFIIAYNVSTMKIFKHQITDNNIQSIILWFQEDDNDVFDIIMNNIEYSGKINKKIRYLNYFDYHPQEITLLFPEMLLFASLQCVKIINLSQCQNIKSLSSDFNQYYINDIQLPNLQNFYSNGDYFVNESNNNTMLSSLFEISKNLRYVHINGGNNVSGNVVLNKNIENIQYIYVDIAPLIKITLNIRCFFNNQQFSLTYLQNPQQSDQIDINQLTLSYISQYYQNIQFQKGYQKMAKYQHIIQFLNEYLSKNNKYYYLLHVKNQNQYSMLYNRQMQGYNRTQIKHIVRYLQNSLKQIQMKNLMVQIQNHQQTVQNYAQLKYYLIHLSQIHNNNISYLFAQSLFDEYFKKTKAYTNYKSIQFNIQQFIKYILNSQNDYIQNELKIQCFEDISKYLEKLKVQYSYIQQNIQHSYHFPVKRDAAQINNANTIINHAINKQSQMIYINTPILLDENHDIKNKDQILPIFQDVENKLQYININFTGIIFYDTIQQNIYAFQQTNKHSRLASLQQNQQTNSELKQYISSNLNNTFNIIINGFQNTDIEHCKIRCLSYINKTVQTNELTLMHPELLVTVSLVKTSICNLNRCAQLTNIYSQQNQYLSRSITALVNIKRFYSVNDQYIGSKSMLDDMFTKNKLQYVQVVDGQNIIGSMILNKNIMDLCFFYLIMKKEIPNVQMMLNEEIPSNLQVFYVTISGRIPGKYTTSLLPIDGSLENIQYVKSCLVH